MKIKEHILAALCIVVCAISAHGQEQRGGEQEKYKKAFELGIGGSVLQFNRVTANHFDSGTDGHFVNLKLQHSVFGGNLYLAKELSRHFALDLQATLGATRQYLQSDMGKNDVKFLFQGGPGLQWRLNSYFKSKYIVPYLRIGANYMYKGFAIDYTRQMGNSAYWEMINNLNKSGADRKHSLSVTPGVGINMWLNDRIGVGLQGDYVILPYKNVANSLQGTVRILFRFGGTTLKTKEVEYVTQVETKYVEVIKEVPVKPDVSEAEKIITLNIYELVSSITFDFDKDVIKEEYKDTIAKIAEIIKNNEDKRFLIIGYTDIRGSSSYNIGLSERRANAVRKALIDHGVSENVLKSRGVGKKTAYAPYGESHRVREGDRKTTIEIINNMDYWNILK